MAPLIRFNSIVVSLTVFIMFLLVRYGRELKDITPQFILDHGDFAQNLYSAGIHLLLTIGLYRVLLWALQQGIGRLRFVKKRVFGSSYIEGTWVGVYGTPTGEIYYAIDVYTQSFAETRLNGTGFSTNKQMRATWYSLYVHVEAHLIEFICDVSMYSPVGRTFAITKFNFITRSRMRLRAYAYRCAVSAAGFLLRRKVKELEAKVVRPAQAQIRGESVNGNDDKKWIKMVKFSDDTDCPEDKALDEAIAYHNQLELIKTLKTAD